MIKTEYGDDNRMLFGGKVIRVDVLDEKGKMILSVEKGFVIPSNMMGDEDSIVMIKGKDLPDIEHNKIVSLITTTKGGDRIKYTGAVSVSMETQLNIKILHTGSNQVLQERRRYFKLKIQEKGRALFYIRDEKTIRYDVPLSIQIIDINVGGIYMRIDDELMADDLVCVELELLEEYPLNAAARVLRVQRNDDGSVDGYGCEFQGLTASQEDYISRYIYKIQSEMRKKEEAKENLF